MRLLDIERTLEIPDNVEVTVDRRRVTVTGEKGSITRDFSHAPLQITKEEKLLKIHASWPRKQERATVGTIASHIENMIKGITNGFTYTLKIVFSHFPISVKIEDKKAIIENFTGERASRIAKLVGDVTVTVQSDDIIVQGVNKEHVSQTAANIEQATRVKKKDPRVFLDGIYVYKRLEGGKA